MKEVASPEEVENTETLAKIDSLEVKTLEESNIALLIIIFALALALDLFDLIPFFINFAGVGFIVSIIVTPLEFLLLILFWLESRKEFKVYRYIIMLLRSSFFVELIVSYIPAIGPFIEILPLRTISFLALMLLKYLISKAEV